MKLGRVRSYLQCASSPFKYSGCCLQKSRGDRLVWRSGYQLMFTAWEILLSWRSTQARRAAWKKSSANDSNLRPNVLNLVNSLLPWCHRIFIHEAVVSRSPRFDICQVYSTWYSPLMKISAFASVHTLGCGHACLILLLYELQHWSWEPVSGQSRPRPQAANRYVNIRMRGPPCIWKLTHLLAVGVPVVFLLQSLSANVYWWYLNHPIDQQLVLSLAPKFVLRHFSRCFTRG